MILKEENMENMDTSCPKCGWSGRFAYRGEGRRPILGSHGVPCTTRPNAKGSAMNRTADQDRTSKWNLVEAVALICIYVGLCVAFCLMLP